jgi:hypothetical protein
MLQMKKVLMSALATMAVAGLAGGAFAQQLNINELGALQAIPFLTSSTVSTKAVLTNGAGGDRSLHFDVINGDPSENWDVESFQCDLTARETVEITFTNDGSGGSDITFECDAVEGVDIAFGGDAGSDGTISSDAERGVLVVTVQDALGATTSENVLFSDFTIYDSGSGEAASAPATSIQGAGANDGNRTYTFNGLEYAQFAAASATNYHPPATNGGQLLIFTLDGTTGAGPWVRVRVLWYDDDEHVEDDAFRFQCFDVVDYNTIAPGLAALDTAGHMELIPVADAATLSPVRPFTCYNMQEGPSGAGSTLRPCNTTTALFTRVPDPALDTQL